MFKLKVSFYMKSGNIIYLRLKVQKYYILFALFDFNFLEKVKELYIASGLNHINYAELEAIIIRKWWQKWG